MATKKTGYRAFRTLTAERKANIDLLLKALGRGAKGLQMGAFINLTNSEDEGITIWPNPRSLGGITLTRWNTGLTKQAAGILDSILYGDQRPGCTRKFKGTNYEAAALWLTRALHTAENEQARKATRKQAVAAEGAATAMHS